MRNYLTNDLLIITIPTLTHEFVYSNLIRRIVNQIYYWIF
jgi:hypothetical protein